MGIFDKLKREMRNATCTGPLHDRYVTFESHQLTCAKCGYDETVQLDPDGRIWVNPECKDAFPRVVKTLPEVCPKCGGRLKVTVHKMKIPKL